MREYLTVIWMACKDLRHDVRMTLCLVLTVAAIALPLLLFFGLKNGVVEVMRQRMLNEPSFMEVISQGTQVLDAAWFDTWGKNPNVGFLVPRTRELGVTAAFVHENKAGTKSKSIRADMQPSGPGDWLLQSYRIAAPLENQCVLTASLAQKLQAEKGSTLIVGIHRQRVNGGMETATKKMLVSGVLPQQATGRDMAFVPLKFLENTESYRDGFGVEEYAWKGEKASAYPIYYGALLLLKELPDAIFAAQMQQRTGFIDLVPLDTHSETFIPVPKDWKAMYLYTGKSAINSFKLQELVDLLRGKESVLMPIAGSKDQPLSILLYESKEDAERAENGMHLDLAAGTLWAASSFENILPSNIAKNVWEDSKRNVATLLVPTHIAQKFPQKIVTAQVKTKTGAQVLMPLQLEATPTLTKDVAIASAGLVGRLNLLLERPLTMGNMPQTAHFGNEDVPLLLGRKNYSRFRMYARSLDQVAPLALELEKSGIAVKTRVADIERVRRMDQYLSLILGLIAGAAIIGGAIALLSSLFASVERKRRSLAVLRLLGIHGVTLCAFPLTAGIVMTFMGICFALFLYHMVSFYINYLAQDFILPGEVLCHLTLEQQLWALLWAFMASIVAGLAAARSLLKIEPAEGLRDE